MCAAGAISGDFGLGLKTSAMLIREVRRFSDIHEIQGTRAIEDGILLHTYVKPEQIGWALASA